MNSQETISTETFILYRNAIKLDLFEAFPLPTPTDISKSECLGDDGIPGLNPAPTHSQLNMIGEDVPSDSVDSSTLPTELPQLQRFSGDQELLEMNSKT
jgi:hypothetical protein